jgi:hypothetical protein
MSQVDESWEPIHQRLMQEFWGAVKATAERQEVPNNTPATQYSFEPPAGFPEGSKEFFERMAFAIVRVQMEEILRNMVDSTLTAVAKEMFEQQRR